MTDVDASAADPRTAAYAPWRFRLAVLTALMTLPLILVGGLVTSKDAGLSVPDWPTSFGHNMFALPWHKWIGKVFYEHSHRLFGSIVGFLTLTLTFWTAAAEPRRWLRRLTWLALAAVCVQGLMGGLRVNLNTDPRFGPYAIGFAMAHGCFAQAFFVLITLLAVVQSRPWLQARGDRRAESQIGSAARNTDGYKRLALLLPVLLFGQLVLGALLRHTGAGLIPHAIGALVIAGLIAALFLRARADLAPGSGCRRGAHLLLFGLAAQIVLGVGSWLATFGLGPLGASAAARELIPTAHVVLGALILVTAAAHALAARSLVEAPAASLEAAAVLEGSAA